MRVEAFDFVFGAGIKGDVFCGGGLLEDCCGYYGAGGVGMGVEDVEKGTA